MTAWCHTPVIPTLGEGQSRKESYDFKVSLDCNSDFKASLSNIANEKRKRKRQVKRTEVTVFE